MKLTHANDVGVGERRDGEVLQCRGMLVNQHDAAAIGRAS